VIIKNRKSRKKYFLNVIIFKKYTRLNAPPPQRSGGNPVVKLR